MREGCDLIAPAVVVLPRLDGQFAALLVLSHKLPDQIPDDIVPSVTLVGLPLFHIGAIQLLLVPLMTGSRVVSFEGKFDAGVLLGLAESEGNSPRPGRLLLRTLAETRPMPS